jgi:hypothetical protein
LSGARGIIIYNNDLFLLSRGHVHNPTTMQDYKGFP